MEFPVKFINKWLNYSNFNFLLHSSLKISRDQFEKNEMGGVCSTYGGEERCVEDFGGEIWGEESTWKT
jgi:hypothetical protein